MDWRDDAFVLTAQRFGEGDAVLDVLTRDHGRHLGLEKGGMSKTRRADLQPGNLLSVEWKARLSDHLGRFEVEPVRAYASLAMDSAIALAARMRARIIGRSFRGMVRLRVEQGSDRAASPAECRRAARPGVIVRDRARPMVAAKVAGPAAFPVRGSSRSRQHRDRAGFFGAHRPSAAA